MEMVPHKRNFQFYFLMAGIVIFFGALLFRTHGPETKKISEPAPLRSELVRSSQDQSLKQFSLTGFDDKGKKFWNLEGDTARINPTQEVYLNDHVTLKLKDDTLVRTDHVQWSQGGGTLTTDAPVFVDHQNVKIKGLGAFGRPGDSFIQLNRKIEMVINPNTILTCQGPMKIFYKENTIVFYRKVKVKDERGILSANRMDVFFDPTDKKIKQIFAVGNVVIERGSDTTRSQRAVYSVATGSIRLEGNPEVTLHKAGPNIFDHPIKK